VRPTRRPARGGRPAAAGPRRPARGGRPAAARVSDRVARESDVRRLCHRVGKPCASGTRQRTHPLSRPRPTAAGRDQAAASQLEREHLDDEVPDRSDSPHRPDDFRFPPIFAADTQSPPLTRAIAARQATVERLRSRICRAKSALEIHHATTSARVSSTPTIDAGHRGRRLRHSDGGAAVVDNDCGTATSRRRPRPGTTAKGCNRGHRR
jgi:hypothetical protein